MKKILINIAIGIIIAFSIPQINGQNAAEFKAEITYTEEGQQWIQDFTFEHDKPIILDDGKKYQIQIEAIRKVDLESIIRDLQILTGGN